VGSDGNAGLVEEADHLAVDFGVEMRVAAIALAFRVDVGRGGVTEPIVPGPAGARAAGAVHVDFGSAGEQAAVAERGWQARNALNLVQCFLGLSQSCSRVPEDADALFELARVEDGL